MAKTATTTTSVKPGRGLVTWDSEGTEGGQYHSRTLSVPTDTSGLTVGRGYDMKERRPADIIQDLTAAGVPTVDAARIAKAAGMSGDDARDFISDNHLDTFEISPAAQKALFERTYSKIAADTERLCEKQDVVKKYGDCDWDELDPAIADALVDLRFRGDYTPQARSKIQDAVVANDLDAFYAKMKDRSNWKNVPKDRFDRRVAALKAAVEQKKRAKRLTQKVPVSQPK